jgi:hypothetical protein
MRARRLFAATLTVLVSAASCSPAPTPASPVKPMPRDAGAEASASDPAWLRGEIVAQVPDSTLGPYVAWGQEGALAFFAPGGAQERKWLAQPLGSNGAASGKPVEVARAPDDAPVVVVRATAGGFVAIWVRRLDHGTALEAVSLDSAGKPRSEPSTLAQATGQIVWADITSSSQGTVVFWAEQRRDKASISSIHLEPNGRSSPSEVQQLLPAARAWQVTPTPSGSALAVVRAAEPTGATVALILLDARGKPVGQPLSVSESPTAALDVDVARLGNALVFAWTDRRDLDNHVYVAATDLNGKVTAPAHALTPPLGEQSFLSLVAPRTGTDAALVYEDYAERGAQRRAIRVTTIDAKAAAGSRTIAIDHRAGDRELPEVVGSPDGFAVLAYGLACQTGRPCPAASAGPAYARLDASLSVLAGSPLMVDKLSGNQPTNAWGLGCGKESCHALVAGTTVPAPVIAVSLPVRKSDYQPPVAWLPPMAPPKALSNEVLRSINEHISELSAAQVGDRVLVGWITYFVEPPSAPAAPGAPAPKKAKSLGEPAAAAPGDPKKPTAANLSLLSLDASGKAAAAPTIISVRALSAGGVAIAPGAPSSKDACLAWVARDAGDPQVFVTRVTAEGKRDGQQMLTRVRGDASDTAIAWAGDGWVVAWIDTRDGNGEVYAAKVDRMLRKVVQDTRITSAAGDASDVGVFARGNEVFVTWSDPRDAGSDGHGDPYVQKLSAANLAKIGAESRLDQSPHHARSVHISALGQDLVAGWLAQPIFEAQADPNHPAGPRFVRIDPKTAAPIGDVVATRWPAGVAPTSFGFSCAEDVCRGIVAASPGDTLRAEAVVWFPPSPVMQIKTVFSLTGPPGEDVAPNLVGDQVFFADEASAGDVRLRRAKLAWVTQ